MSSFSKTDIEFITSFGKFVQEHVFIPVPILIISPFSINTINKYHADAFISDINNNIIQVKSDIISTIRLNYLIKYTINFELFKRNCMIIIQFLLQVLSIILICTLW